MNPASSSKHQQKEQHSLQYAAKILGLGYDRKTPHQINFALRALEDSSETIEKQLIVATGNSSTCEYSASTLEEAVENCENKLNLPFKATFLDISGGAAYKKGNSGTLINGLKTLFHTVHQVDYHSCTYKNYPCLKSFLPLKSIPGEFVKSVWVYTGYKIYVHIRYQETIELTSSSSSLEGQVGYSSFSFGPSKDTLEHSLKNKEIIDISLELKTLSDFDLETPMGPIHTLSELRTACQNIRSSYLEKLHTISTRNFFINPNEDLELVTSAPQPSGLLPFEEQFPFIDIQPGKVNFVELSRKITSDTKYELALTNSLGKIPLYELLGSMNSIFSFLIKNKIPTKPPKNGYSIVFGATGHGKSTLIGYKNGSNVVLKENDEGDLAFYYPEDDKHCPLMGKEGDPSTTKGFLVYEDCIDTAGFFDSKGKAEEICNQIAVDLGIKLLQPKRLIILLRPSAIFDTKGKEFFRLIKKLRQILWNPTDPLVFSSILFVFNEVIKNPDNKLLTREQIQRSIQRAIDRLDKEIDDYMSKYSGLTDWLSKRALWAGNKVGLGNIVELTQMEEWIRNKAEDIKGIDPEVAGNIIGSLQDRALLEQLKDQGQFIIADFRQGKTRNEIKKWEDAAPQLPLSAFIIRDSVDQNRFPFIQTLFTTVGYFTTQLKKAHLLEASIKGLTHKIKEIKLTLQNIPEDSSLTEKDIQESKTNLEKKQKEIAALTGTVQATQTTIDDLQKEKTDLEGNTEKTYLKNLTPKTPISSRSVLAYWDCAAKKYRFEHKGENILTHDLKEPTKSRNAPGKFLDERPGRFLTSSQFSMNNGLNTSSFNIQYLPGYYGFPEDAQAEVLLYVKKNEHPDTLKRVAVIERNLFDQKLVFKRTTGNIQDCQAIIAALQIQICNGNQTLANQKTKEAYAKQLTDFQKQVKEDSIELGKIQSELATYKNYCQLLRQILERFQSCQFIGNYGMESNLHQRNQELAQEFIQLFS